MQDSSWHEVYGFFNLKLLQCLPLKTFVTEVIAIPQYLLIHKYAMAIDTMDWIVIL